MRTSVGYGGGTTADPTYETIGDHTELVQVHFDEEIISYDELLEVYLGGNHWRRPSASRQYRSVILFHDPTQEAAARRAIESRGGSPFLGLEPLRSFYRAEAYHQKYRLRYERKLMGALLPLFGDERALMDSTLAARVNGLLAGFGTATELERVVLSLPSPPPEEVRELLLRLRR